MGEQRVTKVSGKKQRQQFVDKLLKDVSAIEYMLENEFFENDITRIGAEQEMAIVNKSTYKPSLRAMDILDAMSEHDWVETELAKFNLEINLEPQVLRKDCFSQLAQETSSKLNAIQAVAGPMDIQVILTGILPTLQREDLIMENLTPKKRYKALMEAINDQLIGSNYELKLIGIDELKLAHDSPLLEAVNTSFQVHLQVSQHDFVGKYNLAQAICGPMIASAANSPIVFGRRLWHESRIAMFQQALDTRSFQQHLRQRSPRVSFGKNWLENSILEIYKEDIARFRVLLSADVEENSLETLKSGQIPKLRALQVHNSTVYRWNRPCYGVSPNGKPHLRIENRVFAAGPTVADEIANAAFWLGCMEGMYLEVPDVTKRLGFDDARDNFSKAARYGIDSEFSWFDDQKINSRDLILKELLPFARKGLEHHSVSSGDIDYYLGIIEERVKKHQTGARWLLRAYTDLKNKTSQDDACTVITKVIATNQTSDKPVHEWPLPKLQDLPQYSTKGLRVQDIMTTDVFTVQKDEIPELAARMMDWNHMDYTPVEDSKGQLVGLLNSGTLLRYFVDKKHQKIRKMTAIADIMIENPPTVEPEASLQEALKLMKKNKMGCLPVVKNKELVGVITRNSFMQLVTSMLERNTE